MSDKWTRKDLHRIKELSKHLDNLTAAEMQFLRDKGVKMLDNQMEAFKPQIGDWAQHGEHRYELCGIDWHRGRIRYVRYRLADVGNGRAHRMLYSAWKKIWEQATDKGRVS